MICNTNVLTNMNETIVKKCSYYLSESKHFRIILIVLVTIEMVFFSGISYGLNTLFPILNDMDFFNEYCNNVSISSESSACAETLFGYLLVTGSISVTVLPFVFGVLRDYCSSRVLKLLAAAIFLSGSLLSAGATSNSVNLPPWLLFSGTACLAAVSQMLALVNYPLASLFPRYQNILVCLFSGAFDTSIGVYTLFYLGKSGPAHISLATSFTVLGVIGALEMTITALTVMAGFDRLQCSSDDSEPLLADQHVTDVFNRGPQNLQIEFEHQLEERYPSIATIFFSKVFMFHVSFVIILAFRFNFFLAQLPLQLSLTFPTQQDDVDNLLVQSNYIFLISVFFCTVPGFVADSARNRVMITHQPQLPGANEKLYYRVCASFALPLLVACVANQIISIFVVVPFKAAFYICFIAIVISRAFLFALNAAFMLQCFPRRNFGLIVGATMLLAGSFTFLQYALLLVSDLISLNLVNYVLMGFSAIAFIHPILLLWRART